MMRTIICKHLKWFKTTAPSIDMKQFWLSGSLGENKNADNNDSNCGGDADNYLQVIEVKIITEKSHFYHLASKVAKVYLKCQNWSIWPAGGPTELPDVSI